MRESDSSYFVPVWFGALDSDVDYVTGPFVHLMLCPPEELGVDTIDDPKVWSCCCAEVPVYLGPTNYSFSS